MTSQRIQVEEEMVQAIKGWPVLKTVGEIKSFHGIDGFYIQFVKHFNSIATPLTEIIKKIVGFTWGQE